MIEPSPLHSVLVYRSATGGDYSSAKDSRSCALDRLTLCLEQNNLSRAVQLIVGPDVSSIRSLQACRVLALLRSKSLCARKGERPINSTRSMTYRMPSIVKYDTWGLHGQLEYGLQIGALPLRCAQLGFPVQPLASRLWSPWDDSLSAAISLLKNSPLETLSNRGHHIL